MTTATATMPAEEIAGTQDAVNETEGVQEARPANEPPMCGQWLGVSDAEYHACHSHLSNSMLSEFIQSIPLFHQRYVTHTLPLRESSGSMNLGSAVHTLVLEGEGEYARLYAVAPKCDRRTSEGKKVYADFVVASAGKTVLSAEDDAKARGMAAGVRANPTAMTLLLMPARTEVAITWQDAIHGIPCRAKIDRITDDLTTVIDLKTTRDPRPDEFAKSVANYGYHRQQAFYRAGCRAVYGYDPEFVFIAVCEAAPYECVVYRLNDRFRRIAECEISIALEEMAYCRQTGDWQGRLSENIINLTPPSWVNQF